MSVNNKISEIPRCDLPQLRDLYLIDWPIHAIAYGVVQNYGRWLTKDPSYTDVKFYCLNSDWRNGTFIVVDKRALFTYTLNNDTENLRELVRLLPKPESVFCNGAFQPNVKAVKEEFTSLDLNQTLEKVAEIFHLPKSRGIEFDVIPPPGIIMKPVSIDHIPHLRENYYFKDLHTEKMFEIMICFNPSLGLFDATNGELMGWCLRYTSGVLTVLQVEDKHRRKGYAQLLVKGMVKKLAEMGDDTFVYIVKGNIPSQRLFEKLGFENTGQEITWMNFIPKK